jgi:hypothetical protein
VVNGVRTKNFDKFIKVNEDKAKQNEQKGVYTKLDQEIKKL